MIDLILSEDSRQFQELTRNFAQKEIAPEAHRYDHSGTFPENIFSEAAELGLTSVLLPEEYGGLGLSLSDACVIVEEVAVACAGTALTLVGNLFALAPLLVAADKTSLERVSTALVEGGFVGRVLAPAKLTVENGQKKLESGDLLVLNGEHGSFFVVPAKDDSMQLQFFLLQKDQLRTQAALPRFGLKAADIATMSADNVQLLEQNMVKFGGSGEELLARSELLTAPLFAACATGIIRAALEHSLRYSKERNAFGQPISSFQAVAFMMSDMARSYQAARLMTWRAARLYDTGTYDQVSALAACGFAMDGAMVAATDAVQIFGGYGYSKEYPVEKLMRDAKLLQMLQPTSFETRVSLGRELLAMR